MHEQAHAITSSKSGYTTKEHDPGSFKLGITVGNSSGERAMLDLRANINMMPYTVFERLGLSRPNSTSICLRLADQSSRNPRGVVEDVILKVD